MQNKLKKKKQTNQRINFNFSARAKGHSKPQLLQNWPETTR